MIPDILFCIDILADVFLIIIGCGYLWDCIR